MKIGKRIFFSFLCVFSIILTAKAQDNWPFNEFDETHYDDYSNNQNVVINSGVYTNYSWNDWIYIGNSPYSPLYGKSNVVLNPGAKLNFSGEYFEINPNTTFKVGSLVNMVYYYSIPVGTETIKKQLRNYTDIIQYEDTVMKYTGGIGGGSDWGLHIPTGSIQFGYVHNVSSNLPSGWRIHQLIDKISSEQFDFLAFSGILGRSGGSPFANSLVLLGSSGMLGIGQRPYSIELTVGGNMLANSYLKSSDRRLKHDIRPISNSSNVVCGLIPKTYLKKATNKQESGFLAQEVENVIPDLVYKDQTSGDYSVDYQGILPFILEAIKEQQKIIDNNQVQIDKMKDLLK